MRTDGYTDIQHENPHEVQKQIM